MANIITELHLEMSDNWYVSKKLNSVGRVGENTVTKLIIEPTEILDNVTYEIEIADASGSKNVAELTIDGTELYLILTANMLTTSGITKMQVRGLFTDGSIKKSNIFELKVNRSISATEHYEEYAVTIFDQLVQDCRDIIEGAESYAIRAETAAVNAEAYEQSASVSAEAASASASTASTASTAAVNAATSAETSANTAHTSAETATTAAASASTSASNASTSAQTAQSASVTAQSASEAAQTASTTATTASETAVNASTSASAAASNASTYADNAATSASNASNSAASASTSASNAATSETNAAASATSATNSATSANTSATNAANSATSAATSATNAHTSEVNASNSETNASTSAAEAEASAESIAASVAQINENTYRINDLEAIIAGYQEADLPTGQIATVTDGTALLMPSLKVGIEPVQSGSGDPSPDNIRPISGWTGCEVIDDAVYGGFINWNQIAPTSNLPSITTFSNGVYTLNYTAPGTTSRQVIGSATYSANHVIYVDVKFKKTYDNIPAFRLYSPATGLYYGEYINTSKAQIFKNESTNIQLWHNYVEANKEYKLDFYYTVIDLTQVFGSTKADEIYAMEQAKSESGVAYFKSLFYKDYYAYNSGEITNVSAVNGDTDKYRTYTIQFKDGDNPLTVYGGTLDVVNGELVVNRVLLYVDGSFNVSVVGYDSNTQLYYTIIKADLDAPANNPSPQCDKFKPFANVNIGNCYITNYGKYLMAILPDQSANTVAKATQWFEDNPTQFVYELATPITYHLTPTQIRTLVGNNNIWADTGNIIEGKYFKSLS